MKNAPSISNLIIDNFSPALSDSESVKIYFLTISVRECLRAAVQQYVTHVSQAERVVQAHVALSHVDRLQTLSGSLRAYKSGYSCARLRSALIEAQLACVVWQATVRTHRPRPVRHTSCTNIKQNTEITSHVIKHCDCQESERYARSNSHTHYINRLNLYMYMNIQQQ